MRIASAVAVLFLAFFLCGCHNTPVGPVGYTGETDPIYTVIQKVNQNNIPITSLWARHYFEATLVDENKKSHFVNGEGVLLYRKPGEMRIVGKKDIAGEIFEIGTTRDEFWLKMIPEVSTMWWGHYANLGKPCMQPIPIRPDLVLEVLGIGEIDTNLNNDPAPIMRFNNDADAYMFIWNTHLPDRWVAQKEIWYDRQTYRPKLVLLFDANGRIVLRAYLDKYVPVAIPDVPVNQSPVVATSYRLFFPDTQTNMSFELSDVVLKYKNLPNEKSIAMPSEEKAGVDKIVQIDAGCSAEEKPAQQTKVPND